MLVEGECAHPQRPLLCCRELITCMLNPDPNKRANLEDIQKHPWTWSDKSMLAMLVRPFSNALTSRRKMGTPTTRTASS
jgi:serine/threonine protein kinase